MMFFWIVLELAVCVLGQSLVGYRRVRGQLRIAWGPLHGHCMGIAWGHCMRTDNMRYYSSAYCIGILHRDRQKTFPALHRDRHCIGTDKTLHRDRQNTFPARVECLVSAKSLLKLWPPPHCMGQTICVSGKG
jgi:hypothetical protein